MSAPVIRSCTEIFPGNADSNQDGESRPLERYREVPAYVLLGDPGAGKTTAFEIETAELGEQAVKITARDFLTFDPNAHPEWESKTLFVDGLDEVRAGAADVCAPFDAIRGRLDALGRPIFRLSCRQADWLGAYDHSRLEDVSPGGKVTTLRLDPLTNEDISKLLEDHPGVCDAEAFVAEADRQGISDLLRNPQTLGLLVEAVTRGGGDWPASRTETFEMACKQMVREPNQDHLVADRSGELSEHARLLDAAGRACAVQLMAGVAGYTRALGQPDHDYPALASISDACYSHKLLASLPGTRLFTAGGNRFSPVHRHIAEFLAARYLTKVIRRGLPVRRVIALMTGADGTVVTELRGLSGWLAAHCEDAREELIQRDPVGTGLYGDIREFTVEEKGALLESLKRRPSRLETLWTCAAFGPLATCDMRPHIEKVLDDTSRSQDQQMFTAFVLRVLKHGVPMPDLSRILFQIVRDDTRMEGIRRVALDALLHNCPNGQPGSDALIALLDDVQRGVVLDPDKALLGKLLKRFYPHEVSPRKVWHYLSEVAADPDHLHYGEYEVFWTTHILAKSSDRQVAELIDHLPRRHSALRGHFVEELPLRLLIRGLRACGDQLATARLYDWLGVGEIEDGYWMHDETALEIRSWLEERPELQKELVWKDSIAAPQPVKMNFSTMRYTNAFTEPACLTISVPGVWSKPLAG